MIRFAIAFIALVLWGSTAFAAPDDAFGKALMVRIKSEGFRIESIKTTLLRRIQIDSKNSRKRRQTVYNPVTGVVLRDVIFGIEEEGFLTHVHQILGVDLRSFRSGRGGNGNGTGNSDKIKENNGKSDGKGKSDNGNAGNGKSDGKGNSGKGKSN